MEKEFPFPDQGDINILQWHNTSPQFRWLYTPHRYLFIFSFLILFLIVNPKKPTHKLYSFWAFCSVCIASCVQDGPMVRPHPFFWRVVLGFTLTVIVTLLACCYLDREIIRNFLVTITPTAAGDIPPDRDYSMGCTIWDTKNFPDDPLHNVKAVVYDEFMLAHFFGWICKSILLRDTTMCWILSCTFEVVERLLKHWFPNFNECWWDSLILDILLCNGFGIFFGSKLVNNYLVVHQWETRLFSEVKPGKDKFIRFLKQFTPRSYVKYYWQPLKTLKRYFVYVFVMCMVLMFELNIFELKMVLKMTTKNELLIIFMLLHAFIGAPSIFDMYLYAINATNTIGSYAASHILLIMSEFLLVVKSSEGYFTEPTPGWVKITVLAIFAGVFGFPVVWFGIMKKGQKDKTD
ncbi:Phosphatidylserine synthase 2 [Tritrichomonas foetus]|uniref:Phosphatidylserine synthase 2 n=1 Tax=Tritrichomonas foetus TaxID=1144522 RepID=A0A1J4JPG7_9EUKA|nr:Phosphatidylserine synthase 2 [Tritrichomonas foetus]|eukprot:OHS99411.1 Phosphatidylserine synthase 2 [Tritrichomonas foetus]